MRGRNNIILRLLILLDQKKSSAYAGDHGLAGGGRRKEKDGLATADVRPYLERADEPGEAPKQKFWSEDGSFSRDHGFSRGAPLFLTKRIYLL